MESCRTAWNRMIRIVTTPVESPQSDVMAEAVRTVKRH
jgi:hypothetical protein